MDKSQHFERLISTYRRRLQILELQSATFGLSVPPHILLEIEDIKEKISEIDLQLQETLLKTHQGKDIQVENSGQININGNVSNSTIIIGSKNEVQNTEKSE